jgi:hypothetical protein
VDLSVPCRLGKAETAMDDSDKTKPQLLNELALLRQQVRELQDPDPTRERIEGVPPAAWLDGESIMAAVRIRR